MTIVSSHKLAAAGLSFLAVSISSGSADAQTVTLFGTNWIVQRFDYKAEIQWPNPVSPFNQQGLIRIEGATWTANGHILVSTSHQDQSVPTSYANFVLEIAPNLNGQGNVTGFTYVRTVVANDPNLLASPFDLRAGGVAINSASFGAGAGGNVLVADGGASKMLRAYDVNTGALLPLGPTGLGISMSPPLGDFTDLALNFDGAVADWRMYALDEPSRAVDVCTLDGTVLSSFPIAGLVNPAAFPGDPKGIAYLSDVSTWPQTFHGLGGVILVSMGDQQPGLQAFTRAGNEIAYEPLLSSVFQTTASAPKPKIEAIAADAATGRLFLFMEKGSLIDNWVWVLTPDCTGNGIADALDLANGTEMDLNLNLVADRCEPVGTAVCLADGSGTACPCANDSAPGSLGGCRNSLGSSGALRGVGTASLSNDGLFLVGEGMPDGPAAFLQAAVAINGGSGFVFGDGLRCAGGTVVRMKVVANVNGGAYYPAAGDASVSVRGSVVAPGSWHYQVWYRDSAAFCTSSTFNLTNGLTITWNP